MPSSKCGGLIPRRKNRKNAASPTINHGIQSLSVSADQIDALMLELQFFAVINFAAESHVDRSINSPEYFIHTNVIGTSVLLNGARKHGVQRFVQISTHEVYGSLGETGKFTEQSP